jgi:hypothetical protein
MKTREKNLENSVYGVYIAPKALNAIEEKYGL